jgi:DNA-binding transcriptional MocR family regulator
MVSVQYRPSGRTAREISDGFESGIRAGLLPAGEGLPSVRGLAEQLEVAPGTVAAAYKVLRDRGLVESRGRSGTYVRAQPSAVARSAAAPIEADVTDLASGQPDPGLLPRLRPAPWLATAGPAAAPPAFVLPELQALGRERLVADGVPAEAITLTSGGLDGLQRVLSARLRPGDVVAIEDPGWPNALDLVAALGLRPYPLPLDAEGPRPDGLRAALHAGARAVVITSRAQNPTGAFLTQRRASELRQVLDDQPQTLVIEDDHAAELAGVELATLAGATEHWAFIRSTSKPYGPDLRVALVAGDEDTVARVEGRMRSGSGWVSTLLQRLVLDLWTSTEAAASVDAAGPAYDRRRDQLIAALAERGIVATGSTGLNVWVPVADETAVVTGLLRARWAVAPGARFRQASPPGIRITLSALTPASIPRLAADLAAATAVTTPSSYLT